MDNEHRKWLDKNLIEFTNDLDVIEVIPYLVATDRMLREHHVEKVCDGASMRANAFACSCSCVRSRNAKLSAICWKRSKHADHAPIKYFTKHYSNLAKIIWRSYSSVIYPSIMSDRRLPRGP
jgi:hypothetical protein